MTTPSPAAIARRLSPAQRRALLAFDGLYEPREHPRWAFKEDWRRYVFQLRDKRLAHPASRGCRHKLTTLGLAVRAELERMEGGDE